jgi:hypothetical protein
MLRLLLAAITFTLWTAMACAHAAGVEQLEANKKAVAAFEDARPRNTSDRATHNTVRTLPTGRRVSRVILQAAWNIRAIAIN